MFIEHLLSASYQECPHHISISTRGAGTLEEGGAAVELK